MERIWAQEEHSAVITDDFICSAQREKWSEEKVKTTSLRQTYCNHKLILCPLQALHLTIFSYRGLLFWSCAQLPLISILSDSITSGQLQFIVWMVTSHIVGVPYFSVSYTNAHCHFLFLLPSSHLSLLWEDLSHSLNTGEYCYQARSAHAHTRRHTQ